MPIGVKNTVRDTTDYILSFPLAKRIAVNPIFTAVVIAVIITLVIWSVLWFYEVQSEEEPLWKIMAKAGFYSSLISIFLIFVHNDLLMKDFKEKNKSGRVDELFSDINRGITGGPMATDIIPVRIGGPF